MAAHEIRKGAPTKVAEDAQGTPQVDAFDSAPIAECEKRVSAVQNIVWNEFRTCRRWNSPNVKHKPVFVLDIRRQTAGAADDVRSHSGTEQAMFPKVVREFHFIRVRPHGSLRESKISREGRRRIRIPRLEMRVPGI